MKSVKASPKLVYDVHFVDGSFSTYQILDRAKAAAYRRGGRVMRRTAVKGSGIYDTRKRVKAEQRKMAAQRGKDVTATIARLFGVHL